MEDVPWKVLPKATPPFNVPPVGVVAGEDRLLPIVVFNLLPIPPGEGSLYRTVGAVDAVLLDVAVPFPNPNPFPVLPPEFNLGMEEEIGLVFKGVLALGLVGLSNVVLLLFIVGVVVLLMLLLPNKFALLPFTVVPGGEGDDDADVVELRLMVILAFFMASKGLFALFTTGGVVNSKLSSDPVEDNGDEDLALFNNGISTVRTIEAVLGSGSGDLLLSAPPLLHVLCKGDDVDEELCEDAELSEKLPENFRMFTECPLELRLVLLLVTVVVFSVLLLPPLP